MDSGETKSIVRLPLVGSDTPAANALLTMIRRLSSSGSVEEIMAVTTSVVRDLLCADGVTFVLRENDECSYVEETAISPLWKGKRFPIGSCISGWCMIEGRAAVIPCIEEDHRIPHEVYRQTFVRSLAMVPSPQDEPIAAIGAYWRERHKATDADIDLLQGIANAAALALTAVRSREAVPDLNDEALVRPTSHGARTNVSATEPIIRKLESIVQLSTAERDALASLPVRVEQYENRRDIAREGDRRTEACAIIEGLACRYRIVMEGRRQIMSIHTPGDLVGLESLFVDGLDHYIGTLGPARIAFIPHEALRELLTQHPGLAEALWRDTFVDAAIFREWVVNIGRRNAYQRVAHVMCELVTRLRAVGGGSEDRYPVNLTQIELADATGLSTVHINRTLQELRRDGLLHFARSEVRVLDWDGLRRVSEFDERYLRQTHQA